MATKIHKTNAARQLDQLYVKYDLISYDVDESDLSAIHVASQLKEDISKVFKTILLRGDKNGVFVCVVPGDDEIDLKKAASVSHNKKADTVPLKELLPLSGYIRGGCSPIGLKKPYPIYLHQTAKDLPYVYISAGQRGLQVKLNPADLVKVTDATIADLVIDK